VWTVLRGFAILECNKCSHRFCDVPPNAQHAQALYGDEYFTGGGAGYGDYLSESRLLLAQGRRYGRLLARYARPGRVLDVGAAAGFLLKGMTQVGWSGVGIEPNEAMVRYGRERIGVDLRQGTLESFATNEQFDAIAMIQVVAHFYDVRRAFETAAGLLRPGGVWLVETWNKDSLVARMLGRLWHEYSPPTVTQWFSRSTLTNLAGQFGLSLVAVGRPRKRISAGHIRSLLRYKLGGRAAGRVPDRLMQLVPDEAVLPYPAFDLFWLILRRD
jgi:SAM-dependent methyltransferase